MQPTHRTLIVILAIAAGWYVYWKTFKQLQERVDAAEQRAQSAEQRAQSSDKLLLSERKRAEELLVSERKRAEKLLVSERKRADDAVRQLRCELSAISPEDFATYSDDIKTIVLDLCDHYGITHPTKFKPCSLISTQDINSVGTSQERSEC